MSVRFRPYLFLVFGLALAFVVIPSHRTFAAATGTGTSLTTSPITLGLNIKPGTTSTQTLQVMNNTSQPLQINMEIKTFGAYGSTGQAAITDFLPDNPASGWIHLSPSTFTAEPNVWSKVAATIDLPKGASLGYYYAIIFQPVTPNQVAAPKTAIVKGSNAILMLIDTNSANESRQVSIANFSVSKRLYEYLPASFSVTIHNTGNIYLAPAGDIFISKHSNGADTIDSIPINSGGGNVLPDSNRVFKATWNDGFPVFEPEVKNGLTVLDKQDNPVEHLQWNFSKTNKLRFGKYYAQLALEYNNGTHEVLLNSTVSFWVIPWKLLLVAIVILLIVLFGLWSLGRSIYRKIRGIPKKSKRRKAAKLNSQPPHHPHTPQTPTS
jgi:hypothetical protein